MNLDDFKSQWHNFSPEAPSPSQAREIERRAAEQKTETLRVRYRRHCLIMTLVSVAGILICLPFVSEMPVLFACVCVFFAVMGFFQLKMIREIDLADPTRMSVKRTIESICRIERLRRIKRITGIAMSIPLLCYMMFEFTGALGPSVILTCSVGILVGIATGVVLNRSAMKMLGDLRRSLDGEEY